MISCIGINFIKQLKKSLHSNKNKNYAYEDKLESSIKDFDYSKYKNICIVGYDTLPLIYDQKITIIEPVYYDFFENVKNLKYVNKPCYKNSITKFNILKCRKYNQNLDHCIETNDGVYSTTVDENGLFDLICIFPNSQSYESLLGCDKNLKFCNNIMVGLYCWNEDIDSLLSINHFKRHLIMCFDVLSIFYHREL